MEYLITLVIGIAIGFVSTFYFIFRLAVKEDARRKDKKTDVMFCITETHDDQILLFNRVNNSFISQATSLEDLAKNLLAYKNVSAAFVFHDKELLIFDNGSVVRENK